MSYLEHINIDSDANRADVAKALAPLEKVLDVSKKKVKKDGTVSKQGEGGGKPPKIPNKKILSDLVENYLKSCDETKSIPNKAGLRYALHLDRTTYNAYKKKYPNTLRRCEDWIEQCWINRLAGTAATGAIFYLKNAFKEEYKDHYDSDITSGGKPLIISFDNALTARKAKTSS